MCNAASIRLTMLQLLQKEQIFTSVVLSLLLCGGWNWWHAFDFTILVPLLHIFAHLR